LSSDRVMVFSPVVGRVKSGTFFPGITSLILFAPGLVLTSS
jgi:hypothetical protein